MICLRYLLATACWLGLNCKDLMGCWFFVGKKHEAGCHLPACSWSTSSLDSRLHRSDSLSSLNFIVISSFCTSTLIHFCSGPCLGPHPESTQPSSNVPGSARKAVHHGGDSEDSADKEKKYKWSVKPGGRSSISISLSKNLLLI